MLKNRNRNLHMMSTIEMQKHGGNTLIVLFDDKRVLSLSNYLGKKDLLPNENRWVE